MRKEILTTLSEKFYHSIYGLVLFWEYDLHRDTWLPIVDRAFQYYPKKDEYGDVNIGWNAGIMGPNRPYFVECWSEDDVTMLTVYISSDDLGDTLPEELFSDFIDWGYYSARPGAPDVDIRPYTDGNGNHFYTFNIVVGIGDETFIDGANIYPFSQLNNLNATRLQNELEKKQKQA